MMAKRLWVLMVAVVILASCTGGSDASDASTVLVFAAASLSDVFADIETAFEADNPGIDVALNLAGSSALREQILDGSPADVFASANQATMEAVIDEGLATDSVVFAQNRLAIAVRAGNPAGVVGIESFTDDDLFLGVCASGVPCGELARRMFENAGLVPQVDTEEPDVRALLAKVAEGELDAGVVYVTDVVNNDDVDGIEIAPSVNVENEYPIAVINRDGDASDAELFVEFVRSPTGVEILRTHGFVTP